jgi:hypothetical protein
MFININDFTTNGFISALAANTTIIEDNLTASQMLINAGVNLVASRQVVSSGKKTEEHKLLQYYALSFDVWYPLAKFALANVSSGVPATAKFAQQLAARFVPLNLIDPHYLTAIINPSARVHADTLIPTYNFVPNIASLYDTPLYNRTFVQGSGPNLITSRFHSDFVGHDLVLSVYDTNLVVVENITATVNSEGFANFSYSPTLITPGQTYFFGLKSFTIFVPAVYPALVGNLTSKNYLVSNLVQFVAA